MRMNRITETVGEIKRIPENAWLFLKNGWLLLSFDLLDKAVFSFLCGIFSYIIYNAVKSGFSRLLILSEGIRYIDKGNMLSVCTSFKTLLLVLLFLIIMTFCALFEIGGILHAFPMAQVGRRTDIWSMMMVGLRTVCKTLHPRNWLMILFVIILFPLTELITMTTLEDVLLLAKENDMRVQIETKPSEKKPGLGEEVLRIVEETGMHDSVMVISLHSDSIQRIRDLDPEITTAHAVMVTWPAYADVKDADNLSAEIGTITPLLVNELHHAGMKVFCWTADDPSDIQYLVSCGVDVIGTDDPVMVNTMLDRVDCSGGIRRCVYLMMHIFADMGR